MRRSALLLGVASAVIAGAARADDLIDIDSTITKPISTSSAFNNSPGNIVITQPGSLSVRTTGAAVTIDSNNTVQDGSIIQNSGTGGVGVHMEGGFTGGLTVLPNSIASTFTNTGAINVTGDNGKGVLLDGTSAFTGDINFEVGSTLTVGGANAVGIQVSAPLNGNLTAGAVSTVTGVNADGILVTAPVSGLFTTAGSITAAGVATYTSSAVDALSGSAVAIGASIGGGFINAGPVDSSDATTLPSTLGNSGTAATVVIAPSVAGAGASNITIGLATSDVTNPSFSFINRGTIHAAENDPGISTTGVLIGETGAAANTVTLPGGIYNRGSILSSSESDNNFASSVHATDTNATALEIGNGAVINPGTNVAALVNDGVITASMAGSKSGVITGLLIDSGGSLPSLRTTGTISGVTTTTDTGVSNLTAYAIRDMSGTLTSIVNTGAITATATTLDNNSQITVAADISHTSANESFTTSGAVTGDIQFGSAGSSGGVAGNQLVINGVGASVRGAVTTSGAGTVDINVSTDGTGGTLASDNIKAETLDVGTGGTVSVALNKFSGTGARIATSGAAVFAEGSTVNIVPSTFLPTSGTYTLIDAAGGLQFGNYATSVNAAVPFLYDGALSVNGNDLTVTLQRKSAGELGLTGNDAAIYNPLALAALNDDQFGAALLGLTNATDVKAAINATLPDVGGATRALALTLTDETTGVIGARQRSLVTSPTNAHDELRFWGQEFYNSVSGSNTPQQSGYSGVGQGLAFGAEWGAIGSGRYGIGYSFSGSQETENLPRNTKTDGDWHLLSFYSGWRFGDFFVTPQVNAGEVDFMGRRTVALETVDRSTTAKWQGYLASGGSTAGYIFDFGGMQVMPQIALDATYLRQSSYKETGTSSLALSMDAQNQQSVRSFAGVVALGNYTWDDGDFQPQLLAGWSHEFLNSPLAVDGSFEGTPGSAFQLTGPPLASDRVVGGASFAYIFGNWQAGMNYDATASQGAIDETATVSLSSRF